MNVIMAIHIAAGLLALPTGATAAAAHKGGLLHARAGTLFFASMMTLGITASILEPFRQPTPGSPIVGLIVCYFILTSWVTARRRDGTTGKFEILASVVALGTATVTVWGAVNGTASSPVGPGPAYAISALLVLGGLLDLNVVLRRKLTPTQRISRHLWRMCFAFFIATGSFFLGQQDVLPAAMRGSPLLFVLAFAPFAVMAFWLIRLRFAKGVRRLAIRATADPAPAWRA